ncbi:unnamed protein product [Rhizoctonia solani]|uniref:Protein F37C4,5 [Caenorhabditis elegans] n=1 Tax=Rhizoctonia solani TaxID=456999 RepID=A0A8H3I678_9AGAM|nr:unnamed protein product [Rhizoctonia solani]
MVSEQPATNKITVNAAEQDDLIDAVTVFQSHRAEVKRRVNLDLKKGQNHVHIERLPSCLNGDSIRVDGTGTAVIFDVVHHAPSYTSSSSSDESVTAAQHALDTLQKERDIAREQSEFLASYGKTLDSKNVNIEDVQRFLDMFGPRQVAVAKRIQELDVQVGKARAELDKARSKSYQDRQGEKRGTRVTVTVLAEEDGQAELMVTYVVSNANWTPLYDVRASIAKSPDATSKMILHYRASITQTTGENWPEVALTLSTASPQLGSKVPTLSPWKIGFPTPPPLPPGQGSALMKQTARRYCDVELEVEESDQDMGFDLFDDGPGYSAPQMATRQAHVATAGVLSATFGIPGRSDIPSDEGSHKVVVAVLDLEAELEWICVPREKESVFLTCKVINSSEFTLLPGEASVFMDDNFVSKSRIDHVSPNDSFKTSLGVDSSLRVTYPSAKTLNRTTAQSGFSFLARERQSISAQSQRITIRNSRLTSVSDLRVVDHLPVSTDARLKVNVIVPGGLDVQQAPGSPTSPDSESRNKDKQRPWTNVRKGVKARWAPLDVGGEGTVEWNCEIGPSEEVELELAWECDLSNIGIGRDIEFDGSVEGNMSIQVLHNGMQTPWNPSGDTVYSLKGSPIDGLYLQNITLKVLDAAAGARLTINKARVNGSSLSGSGSASDRWVVPSSADGLKYTGFIRHASVTSSTYLSFTAGNTASMLFNGSSLLVYGPCGPDNGRMKVTIDGLGLTCNYLASAPD